MLGRPPMVNPTLHASWDRESMVPPTIALPSPVSDHAHAATQFGSLPLYFEKNVGQADDTFDFVGAGQGTRWD
jgi:hypothetical protein